MCACMHMCICVECPPECFPICCKFLHDSKAKRLLEAQLTSAASLFLLATKSADVDQRTGQEIMK